MITWQQLGFHSKPVGVLNVNGYFDSLLAFFDNCVGEVRPNACSQSCAVDQPRIFVHPLPHVFAPRLTVMAVHVHPSHDRWPPGPTTGFEPPVSARHA